MDQAIRGFNGPNRFLSNFYPSIVKIDGIEFPTVEHAYQASKTNERIVKEIISRLPTPGEAKKYGRHVEMRTDWDNLKIHVMYLLVFQKFTIHDELKNKLLRTNNAYLEETNNWNDTYWGVCKGFGTNHLGNVLMKVREYIIVTSGPLYSKIVF